LLLLNVNVKDFIEMALAEGVLAFCELTENLQ